VEESAPREPRVDDVHATGDAHHRLLSILLCPYPADGNLELHKADSQADLRRTISIIPNY
jgi:hypothetical protein